MKIIAIYTTYNPDINELSQSIESLHNQVDSILIVDNSERFIESNYSQIRYNVTVTSTEGNTGIANALNLGCKIAIHEGYDWALTLDQDSILPFGAINEYKSFLSQNKTRKIGALVPSFTLCKNSKTIIGGTTGNINDYMTSGSLIYLNAYKEVNGFNEELFIDLVDTEYGYKLIQKGYQIIRISKVLMNHNIGDAKEISFRNHHLFYITNHNYIRRYYITRNLLEMQRRYGSQFPCFANAKYKIIKSIIRIILFEKDKIRKLNSIKMGIMDYKNRCYGKYHL